MIFDFEKAVFLSNSLLQKAKKYKNFEIRKKTPSLMKVPVD